MMLEVKDSGASKAVHRWRSLEREACEAATGHKASFVRNGVGEDDPHFPRMEEIQVHNRGRTGSDEKQPSCPYLLESSKYCRTYRVDDWQHPIPA